MVTIRTCVNVSWWFVTGKKGRPVKADLDTGWSKDDERQCALCQKYGDAKASVSTFRTRHSHYSSWDILKDVLPNGHIL